jgi:Holliday junction resolvase RusA-like endonuclease
MSTITIHLPGTPTPKGRGRATRTGRVYTPAKTRAAEESIAGRAMAQVLALPEQQRDALPFAGPLVVRVIFVMPVPASWSQRKRIAALGGSMMPTSKPDLDNLLKLVSDALNGIVWVDDSQIVELVTRKGYGSEPCVHVTVECIAEAQAVAA